MSGKTLTCDILDEMAAAWPSNIVARSQVGVFSGGLLHPRTMANLDSLGEGPKEVVSYGRKRAYVKSSLVSWMRKRMS